MQRSQEAGPQRDARRRGLGGGGFALRAGGWRREPPEWSRGGGTTLNNGTKGSKGWVAGFKEFQKKSQKIVQVRNTEINKCMLGHLRENWAENLVALTKMVWKYLAGLFEKNVWKKLAVCVKKSKGIRILYDTTHWELHHTIQTHIISFRPGRPGSLENVGCGLGGVDCQKSGMKKNWWNKILPNISAPFWLRPAKFSTFPKTFLNIFPIEFKKRAPDFDCQ